VHLCKRKKDDREFALKSIDKSTIKKNERNVAALLSEIDILRLMQHENIIHLEEVFESEKYIHLVLEYLEGGELFERIRSKCLYSEKEAIKVMQKLLTTLAYLAEKGVVHRDLKPENLILASKNSDEDIKIADFGLAAFVKKGELLALRCGSPGYVAPELLENKGVDSLGDVFSVGVIMYVILTGKPAFPGQTMNEILLKNRLCEISYPPKHWDKISDNARDLCQKLLEKDPAKRLSAEDSLKHPWFQQQDFNDQILEETKQNMDRFEEEFNIDYNNKDSDVGKEDGISMFIPTPLMGKKMEHLPPDTSPFLGNRGTPMVNDRTPIMQTKLVDKQGQQFSLNGGLVIRGVVPKKEEKKASFLPEVPKFNKGKTAQDSKAKKVSDIRKNIMGMQMEDLSIKKDLKPKPQSLA